MMRLSVLGLLLVVLNCELVNAIKLFSRRPKLIISSPSVERDDLRMPEQNIEASDVQTSTLNAVYGSIGDIRIALSMVDDKVSKIDAVLGKFGCKLDTLLVSISDVLLEVAEVRESSKKRELSSFRSLDSATIPLLTHSVPPPPPVPAFMNPNAPPPPPLPSMHLPSFNRSGEEPGNDGGSDEADAKVAKATSRKSDSANQQGALLAEISEAIRRKAALRQARGLESEFLLH